MRRHPALAAALGAALASSLVLGACAAGPTPEENPVSTPGAASETPATPETPQAATLTGADIQEWIADAEWSFAPSGVGAPFTVAFEAGRASDDVMRTYEIGVGVAGDADADGITDLAVPVSQLDGNGFLELWYIWLGNDADADDGSVARQVVYPIARTSRCGDVVHSVAPEDDGFTIDQTLWLPHTDQGPDCVSGGTGVQTRTVTVIEIDGEPFPIQTAPVEAWGGVCPRSEWLDGIPDDTIVGRIAPPASAPQVIAAGELVNLFEIAAAPLVAGDGARFFGFQPADLAPESQAEAEATPVTMHCAFAG